MECMKIGVANPKEAETVQQILFDLGYSWAHHGKNFFRTDKRYFYTESCGDILWGDNESDFEQMGKYKEFSLEYSPSLVEKAREKITIGGVKYYKDEFEEAVKNLQPAKE